MSDLGREVDRRLEKMGIAAARRMEMLEEIASYAQDRYDELRAGGHSEADAHRLALVDLETEQLARELARVDSRPPADRPPLGLRRNTFMATLWQDLRYAVRSVRKTPAFSAVVIATLALGIGANAAIFSVADAVMLRPYPYPDLDRILILSETTRSGQGMSVAWPTFQDWSAQNQVFEQLGIYRGAIVNLTGGDQPERLNGSVASSGVFAALGIQPLAGRVFGVEDDRAGAARVAVISERLWRNRFGADPAFLGRSLMLNGEPHTVVGIMPPGMRFPSRLSDVWLPLGPFVGTFPASRGAHPGLIAVGKLRPGITFERFPTTSRSCRTSGRRCSSCSARWRSSC
jgi:hypothetical protein